MDIHLRKFSSSSVSEQETKNNGNRAVNYNKDLFFILLINLIIYSIDGIITEIPYSRFIIFHCGTVKK